MFSSRSSLVFLLTLVFLVSCKPPPAPDFVDLNGQAFTKDGLLGKWVVINYWAEWCKPCIKEIPELNEIHDDRDNYNALIMGVNFDKLALEPLRKVSQKFNIKFPVLRSDPIKVYDLAPPQALPITYIIDPTGNVAHTLAGPQTLESITELLK